MKYKLDYIIHLLKIRKILDTNEKIKMYLN